VIKLAACDGAEIVMAIDTAEEEKEWLRSQRKKGKKRL